LTFEGALRDHPRGEQGVTLEVIGAGFGRTGTRLRHLAPRVLRAHGAAGLRRAEAVALSAERGV